MQFHSHTERVQNFLSESDVKKDLSSVLFDDHQNLDERTSHSFAANTHNAQQCHEILEVLIGTLVPEKFTWRPIFKALTILHKIVLFGSELAVGELFQYTRLIESFKTYNSAISSPFHGLLGGKDEGEPVREISAKIFSILIDDGVIREERRKAREAGGGGLVPIGDRSQVLVNETDEESVLDIFTNTFSSSNSQPQMQFGSGSENIVGATHTLENVPGMYEDRPERYFDSHNDDRSRNVNVRDAQTTRDAQADNLLDLAFGSPMKNSTLPNEVQDLRMDNVAQRQMSQKDQEIADLRKLLDQSQLNNQQQQQQNQQPMNNSLMNDPMNAFSQPMMNNQQPQQQNQQPMPSLSQQVMSNQQPPQQTTSSTGDDRLGNLSNLNKEQLLKLLLLQEQELKKK